MLAHSKWPLMTYSRRTACSLVSQEYLYFTFSFVFGFHCVRWMDVCLIHTALPCQPHEPRHLRSICEGVNSGSVWSPLESGCSKCKNLDRDLKGWGDYFVLLINTVVVEFCFHVLSLLLPANNPIDDSATLTTAVMNPHGSIFFFFNVATCLLSRSVESELNTVAHLGTAGITVRLCQVQPLLHWAARLMTSWQINR